MSNTDIVYRYLKAREAINENADILAVLIEAGRDIDAVELDMDKKDMVKQILDYSDITYCLLNINNHLVLLYPNEQREQYMNIQTQLVFGGPLVEFSGFSYSEAAAVKDFLQAAKTQYSITTNSVGNIQFCLSAVDEPIMDEAIKTLQCEVQNEAGQKYLLSKNISWAHAISQASSAISYSGPVFIGREGGTGGMRLDKDGAVVMTPNSPGRFIPRGDPDFEGKVINVIMNDLNGQSSPIKVVYGSFVDKITYGMSKQDIQKTALTKNEALKILGLSNIPDMDQLEKMFNNDYNDTQKEAFYAVMRMSLCRAIKLKDIQKYKMSKTEKIEYEQLHRANISKFEEMNKEKTSEMSPLHESYRGGDNNER